MPAPSKPKRWTAAMVREFPEDGNRYEVIDGVLLVTPAFVLDLIAFFGTVHAEA